MKIILLIILGENYKKNHLSHKNLGREILNFSK